MPLSGWSNIYKLTIDHTKVDSDLTDFPLMIALSSGTGMTNFDATDVFTSFSGSDGVDWGGFQLSVDVGSEGTWDNLYAIYPCVIKDGSTYKMWYSGSSNGSGYNIIYCDSTDGITWANHQMVISSGTQGIYDSAQCLSPYVIKDEDNTYKMWYGGFNLTNYRIIYCISDNGTTWSGFELAIDIGSEGTYDTTRATMPCVLKEDGLYKMWYGGMDASNFRIIYCTSTDCTTWSGFEMVVDRASEGTYDTQNVHMARIIKDESTYKMWYSGYNASTLKYNEIYCASTDGLTWTDFQLVLPINSQGIYDTSQVRSLSVLNDGGVYKIWYDGYDNVNRRIIYGYSNNSATKNKKIAVSYVGGGSEYQLPVEIELWDAYNQQACLWTKVPTISSGTDTTLCFHYDVTQDDNTNYVGDTGSAPAMDVWDDNFMGVWHLSQDPTTPFEPKILKTEVVTGSTTGAGTASAASTFTAVNCTGLTKENGALKIDLYNSDQGRTYGAQLEITSDATYNSHEWAFSYEYLRSLGITDAYQTFILPLADTVTSGGELEVNAIDYIRYWTQTSYAKTISWRNASIIPYPPVISDSTRNQRNATCSGSMLSTNLVSGLKSKVLTFDGTDDMINLGNHGRVTSFTIEAIINNSAGEGNSRGIVGSYAGGSYINHYGLTSTSGINVNCYYDDGSDWGTVGTDLYTIASGTNYYVAGSMDCNVSGKVYINGTLSGTDVVDIPLYIAPFADMYIGMDGNNTSQSKWQGTLGEVRISNIARADSWIKMNGYCLRDDLVTYSEPYICQGYTELDGTRVSGIPVRLYRSSDGIFVGSTTTTGLDGTFSLPTIYDSYHYVVASHPTNSGINALIYDWLSPTIS